MRTSKKHSKKSRTYKKYGGAKKRTILYDNGDRYTGDVIVKDGEPIKHGKGKMEYNKIHNTEAYVEYNGEWKDDKKHGRGKMLYDEDDQDNYDYEQYLIYDGNWENDKMVGRGEMKFSNGNTYFGEWKDGKIEGYGKMEYAKMYPDDDEIDEEGHSEFEYYRYEGGWLNGLKQGTGKMEFINEDVYNGDWENDKMDGVGTMNYSSDNEKNYLSYSGDWEDNKRSGAGSLLFTDGRFYEGNWEEDQPLCDDYPETYISGDWGDETWKCVDPDFRDSLDADAAEDAADEDDEDLNVALEIHRKSGKINLEKYLEIIDMDKSNQVKYGDVVSYIRPKFEGFIKENFQTEEQPLALLKITEILDKLSSAREVSAKPENVKIIGKTIDFVFRQPKEFVNFYIRVFINDCYHAYSGDDGMSCVGGILERVYMLVGESAFALCPSEDCDIPEYEELLKFFNKRLDKNDLTQLWANTFLESEELKNMTVVQRKQHYVDFMQKKYKENDLFDEITEKLINDEATKLEDAGIFERLEFGGKRRKNNKRSIKTKHKTKKAGVSKKTRKSKK